MKMSCFPILSVFKAARLAAILTATLGGSLAADVPIFEQNARHHPVLARSGMVATQEAHATRAAREILDAGGNAVDAAVVAGFALAVTLPRAGPLGGGGFMLIHLAEENRTFAVDYRERAPLAAHRDLFLDEAGEADANKSRWSSLAVGVPGNVAGFLHVLENYGTLSRAEALAPAIRLAEEGFAVTPDFHASLLFSAPRLVRDPDARRIFLQDTGQPPPIGSIFRQPELAESLRMIAADGASAFYEGSIAHALVEYMERTGGLITLEDLASYAPIERETVTGTYRGFRVHSMPPPSSGGVHLVQILKKLEPFDFSPEEAGSAAVFHLLAEAMKRAYADRSEYLGDPDFVDVPVAALLNPAYLSSRMADFDPTRATPAEKILPGDLTMPEGGDNTTHFSVVDAFGNAVSNTYSINFSYGVHRMIPGTGILLNNTMDDFAAKPGVPNAYGLIGGDRNAVAGGKRMLSSMTPTIVLDAEDKVFLVTGSPGGPRIITTTLQIILNVIDFRMNIAAATSAPRIHHQWLPDEIRIEEGISPDTRRLLEEKGHRLRQQAAMGSTQSILRTEQGWWSGASDPRRPDALTEGH
jgi:gamma-glutamyltranspeptidase/glutathione hydrolase